MEKQVAAFRKSEKEIDYRFIAKIGTLEVWSRALSSRSKIEPALATANQG